jgi:hypothetical protein
MNLPQFKKKTYEINLLRNLYQMRFGKLGLIYKLEDLNRGYYKKVLQTGDVELEHQIGRLTCFKDILNYISRKKVKGDIIEFGTWKGYSLLWISYLVERFRIFDKKIVGIDCFEGLPFSEVPFKKGGFSNTSIKECKNNIFRSDLLYDITKKNIFIEKYLFSNKRGILKKLKSLNIAKLCFVHIDSDLSSSFNEVMDILIDGKLMSSCCFILIDDYGSNLNLSRAVDNR